MTPTVQFHEVDEFTADLFKDKARVDRGIVRVATRLRQAQYGPIRHVSVVSTAIVSGQLVRLDVYCGEDWGSHFKQTGETFEEAKRVSEQLRSFCESNGFDFRDGVLQESRS